MRGSWRVLSIWLLAVGALAACADGPSNPLAAGNAENPSFDRNREHDDGDDDARDGFLRLVSVIGPGEGRFRATSVPHPTTPGNFAVHVEARVHHAKPNTTYLVQRAAEAFATPPGIPSGFDMSTTVDGACQRGLALPPWTTLSPVPPTFVSWPTMITTDARGNGEVDFVFAATFPLPPLFDVMFRVIENSPAPQSVLLTTCTFVPEG